MKHLAKIIVCCHKKDYWRNDDIYMPIQVGKAISSIDLKIQGDDTGDNISYKNKNYCELTGLYWAWKNLDCKYIGLCHYRRYLKLPFSTDIEIDMYMKRFDMIVPKLNILDMSAADKLMHLTTRDDFHIMLMAVMKLYPEYKEDLIDQLYNHNRCSCYNMLFCRKELYDDYCNWLFSIFDEMEKYVRLSRYSRLARLYGFISEYLLLVYSKHNKLRLKEVDIDFISDSKVSTSKSRPCKIIRKTYRYLYNKIHYDLPFWLLYRKQDHFPISSTTTTGFIIDKIPYINEVGEIIYPQ